MSAAHHHSAPEPFRHEAFLYAGTDEFVARMSAFIADGVATGEPTLAVVDARKIDLLREALDGGDDGVLFADMADVGSNPARIIPAWRDFVTNHAETGRAVRGIGEPIHPACGPAELVECHRHEALLNVAFAGTPRFRLLCPYDTDALDPVVIEQARRTHPYVVDRGTARASPAFDGVEVFAEPSADRLPEPPPDAEEIAFGLEGLCDVRAFVRAHAARAGMTRERGRDLLVAVNEVATNSIRHGGGTGRMFLWREPEAIVCEVRDEGRIEQPLAGRERPVAGQIGGYGLWVANQLCDLVQVRAFATGGVVRLHMRTA